MLGPDGSWPVVQAHHLLCDTCYKHTHSMGDPHVRSPSVFMLTRGAAVQSSEAVVEQQ